MEKRSLLYGLLPVGILIGYLLPHPGGQESSEVGQEKPHGQRVRPTPTKPTTNDDSRIRLLADSISEVNTPHREKNLDEIDKADIPLLIDSLLSQSGINGVSYQTQIDIKKLMLRWAEEDFHGAFAWSKAHPNRNASAGFLQIILEQHAKDDLADTLAIIKSLRGTPGINLDLGSQLFDETAKLGAEKAYEMLCLFPKKSLGFRNRPNEFPDGFDFGTFSELLSQSLKSSGTADASFVNLPENFFEEWAKRDSTSALLFYLEEDQLPFVGLGQITNAFLDPTRPESAYPWLSDQYQSLDGAQRTRFASNLRDVFPAEMGAAPLIGLVKSLPTPELRREILIPMLDSFGNKFYGGKRPFIALLSAVPTPRERLEVIKLSQIRSRSSDFSDEQFSELGITREQVEALGGH